MQARREFEAFNVFPDYVAPLHQVALTRFMSKNPNIEGVWVWSQGGGPLRHGPLLIYRRHGIWLWTDANVFATSRLLQDPGLSIEDVTREWVAGVFGDEPRVVDPMTQLLLNSHATAARGLTIPNFARKAVTGLGLDVPPVIYSYWDIVDASSSIYSHVYAVTRGRTAETIEEAFATVDEARHMQLLLSEATPFIVQGQEWLPSMSASLEYEANLLETMAFHKQFALTFWEWVDLGGETRKANWMSAIEAFKTAQFVHRERYDGNLDFPAYNFELVDRSITQAERTDSVVWFSRLLALVLALLIVSSLLDRKHNVVGPWWFPIMLVALVALVLAFTSFAGSAFVVTTGAPLVLYTAGLRLSLFRGRATDYSRAVSPLLVAGLLLALTLSVRGPAYFWLRFWLSDTFRLLLFAGLGMLSIAHIYLTLRLAGGSVTKAWGWLLVLAGASMALYGSFHLAVGFEALLSRLNDELLLLPGMLSRILGITTHLNIPLAIPFYLTATGVALIILGGALVSIGRHRMRVLRV
jgi:hypothetical protein